MRTPLIAANWKMNTTLADAHVLANGVKQRIEHLENIEVLLCPPTIWLTEMAHIVPLHHLKHLKLGAQNIYYPDSGAFTGETSPVMVKELAEYVLVGHSERTHVFKESLDLTALKLSSAIKHGLKPILCIGEDERNEESKRQLVHKLNHLIKELSPEELDTLTVAYEPVWAISGGNAAHQAADPEYADVILTALRSVLPDSVRLLYGGSANNENCRGFLELDHCDGLLIGGASLKLPVFVEMCHIAEDLAKTS